MKSDFYYALTITCIVSCFNAVHSGAQETDPLDWFEDRQAMVVYIDSGEELWRNLQASEILEHPQLVELLDFFETKKFNQLLNQSGFGIASDVQNPAVEDAFATLNSFVDHFLSKRIYFSFRTSEDKKGDQWIIALETDLTSTDECDKVIASGLGWTLESDGVNGNRLEDDSIQTLLDGRCHWFFKSGFLFVGSSIDEVKHLQSRMEANQKPRWAFVDGRKYLRADFQKRKSSSRFREGAVTVYFDPSITTSSFKSLPDKFWNEFGLSSVTGSVIQIGFPKSQDGKSQLFLIVDGQFNLLEPVSQIHIQVLNAPPIDKLPPLPPMWFEVKLGSLEFDTALPSLESAFNRTFGEGSFSKLISSSVAQGCEFDWQKNTGAFGDIVGQASYLYRYSTKEESEPKYYKGTMQLVEVSDRQSAIEMTSKLVQTINDATSRTVMSRAEGIDAGWFLSDRELASRQDEVVGSLSRYNQPIPSREELFIENRGYAIVDSWLLGVERKAYENELMVGHKDHQLEAMLKSVVGPRSNVIAVWATRPYKWKSWLATAIWQMEQQLRTQGKKFSMTGFNQQLRPLDQVQSINELGRQVSLRTVSAVIEKIGTSLFAVSSTGNCYRIRGGLFLSPKTK